MATDRAPIAYVWSTLKAFATGDVITRELLRDSINKAGDIGYGALAALNERFQQLGSTNAGTSAVQRGSVVMGTLSFFDPVDTPTGDLDGKTIVLGTGLGGPTTVTFNQPQSPIEVASQINVQAAALGLVATADSGIDPNTGAVVAANVGKLLLTRPSGGGASLTVYGSGTANGILGFPLIDTTANGTGTVNDGASRIGLAAFGSWVGGSLYSYLSSVVAPAVADVSTKANKAGDTFTGDIVLSDPAEIVYNKSVETQARGQWVIGNGVTDWIHNGGGSIKQNTTAQAVVTADYLFEVVTGDTITAIAIDAFVESPIHSALPATMPSIQLYEWESGQTLPASVSALTDDPSGTVAAFEAPHEVEISGLSITTTPGKRYFLRARTENGTNEQPGYTISNVRVTSTSNGLPPAL